MYTFEDKGGRSITLRPEGTASAARVVLERGLYAGTMPLALYYIGSIFRYEKPQAGRFREHHQFGVELFGTTEYTSDALIIAMLDHFLRAVGLSELVVEINAIGCPVCRPAYHKELIEYFTDRIGDMCGTCHERLAKNPLRILDCKNPVCVAIAADSPVGLDHLCESCETHFDGVKRTLTDMGIAYRINPRIVRGQDYYTNTVFEFVTDKIGAQGTVCGGGRYNGLIQILGGDDLPGIGFGLGLERLLLLLDQSGVEIPLPDPCTLYIATLGDSARAAALPLLRRLTDAGISTETDLMSRSLKAQMKYADKIGARYTLVLGDDEITSGRAELKNMETGEKTAITLDDLQNYAF